jgi:hypothetical protein
VAVPMTVGAATSAEPATTAAGATTAGGAEVRHLPERGAPGWSGLERARPDVPVRGQSDPGQDAGDCGAQRIHLRRVRGCGGLISNQFCTKTANTEVPATKPSGTPRPAVRPTQ